MATFKTNDNVELYEVEGEGKPRAVRLTCTTKFWRKNVKSWLKIVKLSVWICGPTVNRKRLCTATGFRYAMDVKNLRSS